MQIRIRSRLRERKRPGQGCKWSHTLHGVERVRGDRQRFAGQIGQCRRHQAPVIRVRVQPGPHGRPPQPERPERLARLADGPQVGRDGRGIAAELLSEANRGGILEMGPPGLHHAVEGAAALTEGALQPVQRLEQRMQPGQGGQPHGGGKDIVGGLPHVDVVVGMDHGVPATRLSEEFQGPVGEHLVDVHVVRGPRPRLVHVHRELLVPAAADDLPRRRPDGVPDGRAQPAQRHVRLSGRQLHLGRGDDQRRVRAQPADRKILHRAHRLNTVVGVCRDRPLSQRIPFRSRLHGRLRPSPPRMQKGGNLAQVSPLDFTRRFRPPATGSAEP